MTVSAKDVLLRDDIEPGFDEALVLEDMDILAEEAGDWREHIPYNAARCYDDDPDIAAQYAPHVDQCGYCQRLIDAVNPTETWLNEKLIDLRKEAQEEEHPAPEPVPSYWAAAASLLLGVLGTLLVTEWLSPHDDPYRAESVSINALLTRPERLVDLEARNDPEAQFQAARIYLDTDNPRLAYKRIGEGFRLASIDQSVVETVKRIASTDERSAEELAEIAKELKGLSASIKDPKLLSDEDKARFAQLNANLGQHQAAIAFLTQLVEAKENNKMATKNVLAALKTADLAQ